MSSGEYWRHPLQQALCLAGHTVLDLHIVAVRAGLGQGTEVVPAALRVLDDRSPRGTPHDPRDYAVEHDAEERRGVREEHAEEETEEEAVHRALSRAHRCRTSGGDAPGDVFDGMEARADYRDALDGKSLVGQPIDGAFRVRIFRPGGDGASRPRRRRI